MTNKIDGVLRSHNSQEDVILTPKSPPLTLNQSPDVKGNVDFNKHAAKAKEIDSTSTLKGVQSTFSIT